MMEAHKTPEKKEDRITKAFGNVTRSQSEATTEEIIKKSTFVIHQGSYIYAKVGAAPRNPEQHFMVTTDSTETTIITKEENLRNLDVIEKNKDTYALVGLNPAITFYSVGFISTVSAALAKAGINLMVVSTYSKDYFIVNVKHLDLARRILLELGLKELHTMQFRR